MTDTDTVTDDDARLRSELADALVAKGSIGFACDYRPRMFVTSDRTPFSAGLVFVSSDRTQAASGSGPLTSANGLPLLGANDLGPVSAVTLHAQQTRLQAQNRGPNWRTNAVRSDEQNQSITDERVEAAFRAVPRHLFAPPSTSLKDAYADDVIRTKFALSGTCLSSITAPWLQAVMIREAGVRAGMRVLEIGSGGCNAALLAEVTGPDGHVVTMDIDPEVTARAVAALEAAGYTGRVTVITADGEHGAPGHAPFDAVMVTAGAWQIPPAWISQLAPGDSRLVVPLRMNGQTRSIAFRPQAGHLVSTSATVCGFVPAQGAAARPAQVITLTPPGGGQVRVTFEDAAPEQTALADGITDSGPLVTWSGVTVPPMTSFSDLYLWLAGAEPGFCKVTTGEGPRLPGDPERPGTRYPVGITAEGSLACLVTRKLPGTGHEFGVHAYRPAGAAATARLTGGIQAWDQHRQDRYGHLSGDAFAWYPSGTTPPPPDGRPVSAFRKVTGTLVITWPPAGPGAQPADRAG